MHVLCNAPCSVCVTSLCVVFTSPGDGGFVADSTFYQHVGAPWMQDTLYDLAEQYGATNASEWPFLQYADPRTTSTGQRFTSLNFSLPDAYILAYRSRVPPDYTFEEVMSIGVPMFYNIYPNPFHRQFIRQVMDGGEIVSRVPAPTAFPNLALLPVGAPVYYRPWTATTGISTRSDDRGMLLYSVLNGTLYADIDKPRDLWWELVDDASGFQFLHSQDVDHVPLEELMVADRRFEVIESLTLLSRGWTLRLRPSEAFFASQLSDSWANFLAVGLVAAALLALFGGCLIYYALRRSTVRLWALQVSLYLTRARFLFLKCSPLSVFLASAITMR